MAELIAPGDKSGRPLKRTTLFVTAGAAGLLWIGLARPAASAAIRPLVEAPLAGPRYQTMRALARHLDETAQGMLEGADDDLRHGASSEARFLSSIRSFARAAHDFRSRIDGFEATPFAVPLRLADLAGQARLLNDRIRTAGALASTYDEWDAVIDVLQRMTLLLAGNEVKVPRAYVVPPLSAAKLTEFQQLAHDLEISATRAHERAERELENYRERGQQFLGELNYFAALSRDLHTRADAGVVRPKDIGPIVDRLLEEARQADRRMRDANVFTQVWDDSGRTIVILEQMANLVRS
jgi:hypothetical protein